MEHQFQTFSQWCAVDCAVPVDGADTQNVWLETSVARKLFTTERDRHSAIFTVFILSYSSFVEWHVQHLFNFSIEFKLSASGDLRPKLNAVRDQIDAFHREIWFGYEIPEPLHFGPKNCVQNLGQKSCVSVLLLLLEKKKH